MATPSVQSKIWQALKARILTLPVAYPQEMPEDQAFDRPTNGDGSLPYIEVRHMPNIATRFLIDSDGPHDRRGILQLTLCYPVSLKHTYEVMSEKAGQIAAWFPCDFKMPFQGVTVWVEKAADLAQELREDGYIRFPVTVRYQTYA